MKKIALIAAALMAAGVAQAQTKAATSPFYGELGYVFLKTEVDLGTETPKANPTAIRAIAGWDAHQYLALELMVAGGASDDKFDGYITTAKVKNSYGAFLKPKFALNEQFEVFGRLGWAKSKIQLSEPGTTLTSNDSDVAWGLGATYKFNKQWYGSMDYTNYFDKDGVKVDGFAINVGYRF
ncbi:porin family protein [Roseateles sp. SL47]|uniref:porin family protein n=1 Tax=Roseateles sp. SL47 TaxID=2995138 RepID=UPI0022700999|nr:porin family protein [Roseateles sp. SL47]WAC72972.1 porin family protein [Roseateles sp. SL47]